MTFQTESHTAILNIAFSISLAPWASPFCLFLLGMLYNIKVSVYVVSRAVSVGILWAFCRWQIKKKRVWCWLRFSSIDTEKLIPNCSSFHMFLAFATSEIKPRAWNMLYPCSPTDHILRPPDSLKQQRHLHIIKNEFEAAMWLWRSPVS